MESLTTVQGEDINITVENDTVMVDNANVTTADIEASNGIIHVIDSVMLPPSMLEEANETGTNDTDENVTDAGTEPTAVEIIEDSFDPEIAMVMAGETVSWTNMDDEAHTVTAEDGTFDSGEIEPGESFNYTFEETGTFDYYCTIHPDMTGSVIVE
jgi:plastocyanin